jgi:hypothetical protein
MLSSQKLIYLKLYTTDQIRDAHSSYVALQLFVQSFGLLNQLFPSSSTLGKSLQVWYL